MTREILTALLVAGALGLAPAHAAKSDGPDARNLLARMLQAENTLKISGSQVTLLTRGGSVSSSTQRVLRIGSHALRLEYLQPPRLAGEEIVDNGRFYWHYVPSANSLEIGPSRLERIRRRLPQVLDRVRRGGLSISLIGTDTVAGHACAIVQVKPRRTERGPWRRFWIDASNGAQLRIDQFGENGQRLSTSYFTSVSYPPTLDKRSFKPPVTPRNVRVVPLDDASPLLSVAQAQAQAGFHVLEPQYLPSGFRFQAASVSKFHGRTLVTLRYLNGLNMISLFETPQPEKMQQRLHDEPRRPRRNVVQAIQAGLRIILVSGQPTDEAEKVLGALR